MSDAGVSPLGSDTPDDPSVTASESRSEELLGKLVSAFRAVEIHMTEKAEELARTEQRRRENREHMEALRREVSSDLGASLGDSISSDLKRGSDQSSLAPSKLAEAEQECDELVTSAYAQAAVILRNAKTEADAIVSDALAQKALFEREAKSVEVLKSWSKNDRVILNVGGKRFETSHANLVRVPDSMLGVMFSGRHQVTTDPKDNSVFIDRDPTYFHHIINFLRSPEEFVPPQQGEECERLLREADYFLLDPLRHRILYGEYQFSARLQRAPGFEGEMQFTQIHDLFKGTHISLRGPWFALKRSLAARSQDLSETLYHAVLRFPSALYLKPEMVKFAFTLDLQVGADRRIKIPTGRLLGTAAIGPTSERDLDSSGQSQLGNSGQSSNGGGGLGGSGGNGNTSGGGHLQSIAAGPPLVTPAQLHRRQLNMRSERRGDGDSTEYKISGDVVLGTADGELPLGYSRGLVVTIAIKSPGIGILGQVPVFSKFEITGSMRRKIKTRKPPNPGASSSLGASASVPDLTTSLSLSAGPAGLLQGLPAGLPIQLDVDTSYPEEADGWA